MWFDFFIKKDIWKKLKIRSEIKNNHLEIEKFKILYDEEYEQHFVEWFIPKINEFLTKNYPNHHHKIDLNFFKEYSINKNNIYYKRLFILIYDNKTLLEKHIDKIIFKILYLYDRGIVLNNKIDEFYNEDYQLFKTDKSNEIEYIFKTNKEQKVLLNEKFRKILSDEKLNEPIIIKYEHLSCKDRNKILLNSYKGYKLFRIIVEHLKINNKLDYEKDYELDINKIFIDNQNKYLDDQYNYFLIFDYFWNIYSKYDFEKVSALILKISFEDDVNNDYLNEIFLEESNTIFMVRDKLKLNEYPRLLIKLNFGVQDNNKISQNIHTVSELIKSIYNHTVQIQDSGVHNHIYFWINNDYEWLLFYNNEFIEDPLSFFEQMNNNLKNIAFNESSEYYKKEKS